MILPYLVFNNIWSRFFNFLGPLKSENYFTTITNLNFHLRFSLPLTVSVHFYCRPPTLPKVMPLLVLKPVWWQGARGGRGGSGEGDKGKNLFSWLSSTTSPFGSWCLWHGRHSNTNSFVGTCGSFWKSWARPFGRNWYQHVTGKKAGFSLYRGFNSAPCLAQV